MTRRSTRAPHHAAALLLAGASLLLACGGDPNAAADTEEAGPAGGAITIFTDSTELFLEHPALVVGAPEKFAVHLTDITDFAPLRSGRVTLRFVPRDGGETLTVVQETPRAPGIYGPSPAFVRAGIYDLTILVRSPQAKDSISVRGLLVYATVAEAPIDSGGAEPTGVSFLKEQQWKTDGFRTAFATVGTVADAFEAPGDVVAANGRLAEVAAPTAGLLEVSGLSDAPVVGARVAKGQVLARLRPALGDAGAVYPEARARLREAEDEYARAKRLFAAEAVPERRVHEAEIRLAAAREALTGTGGGALDAEGRVEIIAAIHGVISARTLTPGARVEAGTALFTIVDHEVAWLTAHVPAALAARVDRASRATFQVEGSRTTLHTVRVVSMGSIIDPMSRTVPVTYEFANGDGAVRIGSVARVSVATASRLTGLVVPTAAILEEDGRPFVFVQASGERFERREVSLGGTDGVRTLVRSGLRAGDRVVTGAAYQIKLASLSTAVPAHGHEH